MLVGAQRVGPVYHSAKYPADRIHITKELNFIFNNFIQLLFRVVC
jgi:hypothetical protein